MTSITQDMKYRLSLIRCAEKYGVTKAAIKYKTNREIQLIRNMRRRNPHTGLVTFWVKLRQRGYTRSITGLYRILKKQGMTAEKLLSGRSNSSGICAEGILIPV